MNRSAPGFEERVLGACSRVPCGRVTTYKDIAHLLGVRAYRAVGQALRRNRSLVVIPCHRVVRSDGSLGGYVGEEDSARKAVLLRKEGIVIENGRIKDLEKVRYRFRGP